MIEKNCAQLTVSCNNLLCWHTGLGLKAVNILGIAPQQQALVVQQSQEVVGRCGLEFAWKKLLHPNNVTLSGVRLEFAPRSRVFLF